MSAPDLTTLLAGAGTLPTLPQVVTHILETLNDDNADADSLVQRLNTDPVIVARLLAAANSSAFGLSTQVASTRQAILVLGLKTVRTITLATALIEQFGNDTSGFDGRLLWRHSVGVATCARVIAERIGHNAEAAFSAGLLHDIGQLLMLAVAPDACAEVRIRMRQGDVGIVAAEQEIFGYDHAIAGGELPLCKDCQRLLMHAFTKRSTCPMNPKPACKHCPNHCYHPTYREQIRQVMKFSGRKLVMSGRLDLLVKLLF